MKRISTSDFDESFNSFFDKTNKTVQQGEVSGPIALSKQELDAFTNGMYMYICRQTDGDKQTAIIIRQIPNKDIQSLSNNNVASLDATASLNDSYVISIDPNPDTCPPNCTT